MEERVTITKIKDIQQGSTSYSYRPVLSDQQQLSDHPTIKRNLVWHCKVLGEEAHYFRAVPKVRITQ